VKLETTVNMGLRVQEDQQAYQVVKESVEELGVMEKEAFLVRLVLKENLEGEILLYSVKNVYKFSAASDFKVCLEKRVIEEKLVILEKR
jgi:hypothetical protein